MDTGSPPRPISAGVGGIKTSDPAGNLKADQLIGDFKIKDGYRPMSIRTRVYDDEDPKAAGRTNESDFPLSGGTSRI
jgi:hypothetical protein